MNLKLALACTLTAVAAASAQAADLVIATVNNGHMIEMQKHSKDFEAANPGIKLKWVTLEEGVLRQRVTTDIATKGGQFDVMTIGLYEAPIWSKKGWLLPIANMGRFCSSTICMRRPSAGASRSRTSASSSNQR